jgi:hypothetical protein
MAAYGGFDSFRLLIWGDSYLFLLLQLLFQVHVIAKMGNLGRFYTQYEARKRYSGEGRNCIRPASKPDAWRCWRSR